MGDGPAGKEARGHPPSSRGHVHVPPRWRACARRGAGPGPRVPGHCSEPGLGRVAGPSVGRARGLRTPGAPLPWRPAVLAQPSVPLHLGSFQKTRSSWPQTCGNQPTRRLWHGARPPRLRHLLQVGRVGVPRARRASGPRSLSPRAALEPGAAKRPPLTRVPPLGLRVSHFRIAHGPPRTAPRAQSGPYRRPRQAGRSAQPRLARVPDGSLAASCSSRPRPPGAAGRAAGGTHSGLNPTGLCRPLPRAARG